MKMRAYIMGKDDYSKGLDLADNPYKFCQIDCWSAWRKGWLDM